MSKETCKICGARTENMVFHFKKHHPEIITVFQQLENITNTATTPMELKTMIEVVFQEHLDPTFYFSSFPNRITKTYVSGEDNNVRACGIKTDGHVHMLTGGIDWVCDNKGIFSKLSPTFFLCRNRYLISQGWISYYFFQDQDQISLYVDKFPAMSKRLRTENELPLLKLDFQKACGRLEHELLEKVNDRIANHPLVDEIKSYIRKTEQIQLQLEKQLELLESNIKNEVIKEGKIEMPEVPFLSCINDKDYQKLCSMTNQSNCPTSFSNDSCQKLIKTFVELNQRVEEIIQLRPEVLL